MDIGRKYALNGYVDDGYAEVVLYEPIRVYTLFGKSARVFPFPPNWATPVVETLEWKTEVHRARNGKEQRRTLRVIPRRGFEFNLLLQGEMAAMFDAYLWGWQHRHFALPVWTDIGRLTANLYAGETVIPVNTANLGFRVGDYALIYFNPKIFELVEIDAVASDSITAVDQLGVDWPSGTKVYPVILAHLTQQAQATRHTSAVEQLNSLMFDTSPDTAYDHIEVSTPATMYDGIEVITAKPNWKAAINNDFTRQFDVVDAEVGPIGYYDGEATSRVTRPFSWFLRNRDEIMEFRSLMGRLRGQAKTVWVPSWHDDFIVAGSNVLDQSTLIIKGSWFHTLVGIDTSRDRLSIRLANGTTHCRRIESMAPDYTADITLIQLDTTLGATVQPGDGSRIQLLLRCRLATDKIVIPWLTDSVSQPQTMFTTVPL